MELTARGKELKEAAERLRERHGLVARVQGYLINSNNEYNINAEYMAEVGAAGLLTTLDYEAVMEERDIARMCAYPCCPHRLPALLPHYNVFESRAGPPGKEEEGEWREKYDVVNMCMVERTDRLRHCSDRCATASALFLSALDTSPPLIRNVKQASFLPPPLRSQKGGDDKGKELEVINDREEADKQFRQGVEIIEGAKEASASLTFAGHALAIDGFLVHSSNNKERKVVTYQINNYNNNNINNNNNQSSKERGRNVEVNNEDNYRDEKEEQKYMHVEDNINDDSDDNDGEVTMEAAQRYYPFGNASAFVHSLLALLLTPRSKRLFSNDDNWNDNHEDEVVIFDRRRAYLWRMVKRSAKTILAQVGVGIVQGGEERAIICALRKTVNSFDFPLPLPHLPGHLALAFTLTLLLAISSIPTKRSSPSIQIAAARTIVAAPQFNTVMASVGLHHDIAVIASSLFVD